MENKFIMYIPLYKTTEEKKRIQKEEELGQEENQFIIYILREWITMNKPSICKANKLKSNELLLN